MIRIEKYRDVDGAIIYTARDTRLPGLAVTAHEQEMAERAVQWTVEEEKKKERNKKVLFV